MSKFVRVEYVMQRDERSRKYFENLMRSKYNHDRVKMIGGKLMVDENYDVGIRHEVYNLYIEASHIAKNTHNLAVYISRYLDRDEVNALYLYLRYASFKHFQRAELIKKLLTRFINENSLFGVHS
jgi:hypothetical protein